MTRPSSQQSPHGRGRKLPRRHAGLRPSPSTFAATLTAESIFAHWACDDWDAIAAEVSAAQNISHGMASSQMYLAAALRERLPKVAAAFADGTISARLASAIVWHTHLIRDPEALALVDKALAEDATRYGPLSASKTAQAIDAVVDRHDPGALRRTRATARSRDIVIDQSNHESGTTPLWGRLYATDAAVLDRRLLQMAHDVCDDDPRTIAQRRADALGALAAGAERLTCGCENVDCPARAETGDSPTGVVIHVVAEASTLESEPDPHMSGEMQSRPITPGMTVEEIIGARPGTQSPGEQASLGAHHRRRHGARDPAGRAGSTWRPRSALAPSGR